VSPLRCEKPQNWPLSKLNTSGLHAANENEVSSSVKEGPADCITVPEVMAALRKMEKHKTSSLSGLVAEMIMIIQAYGIL